MDSLMLQQSCVPTEVLSAYGAGKGFLFQMGFVVSKEARGTAEGFVTFLALVGPLPCMDSLVNHQVGLPAEALPTFCTHKHLFSCVDLQVGQQPAVALEALPAFWTLEGFLFPVQFLAISAEDEFPGVSFFVRGIVTGCPPLWALGFTYLRQFLLLKVFREAFLLLIVPQNAVP